MSSLLDKSGGIQSGVALRLLPQSRTLARISRRLENGESINL